MEDLIIIKSENNFEKTIELLERELSERKIDLFYVIDHKKNAESVEMQMNNEKVFLFGSPKVGTLLMQTDPSIGIELPLKILIFEDGNKGVYIQYKDPKLLSQKYKVEAKAELLEKTSALLADISNKIKKDTP